MAPDAVLTVSQITAYIKSRFVEDPLLGDVWLSGEVSNFKQHTSGHCYFTLKDASASIKAVIWRTAAQRLALPRDGDAVIAHGYVSVYEQQGVYQLYVDHIEPTGAGRLWLEFERLRARLEAEGLFAAERKRAIPGLPQRLGVVTSPTGAALQDILRTLRHRCPFVDVLVAPAIVQGEKGPSSVVAALEALNRWSAEREQLDAILLARGGGSIEELWAFNDEQVARAVAGSAVPVITGIGHESDFTIADFAADLRAPTPTGAANAATPEAGALRRAVAGMAEHARTQLTARLAGLSTGVRGLTDRARRSAPDKQLPLHRQHIDDLTRRAALAVDRSLHIRRERLEGRRLRLLALDPGRVLARGYAIVTRDGAIVSSVNQVAPGDVIGVRVADGEFGAQVT